MNHVSVKSCQVTDCCMNQNGKCHSMAIQVGDEHTPACDTYSPTGGVCGMPELNADVGACKVSGCKYNKSLLCDAPGIAVGWKDGLPECMTFEKK